MSMDIFKTKAGDSVKHHTLNAGHATEIRFTGSYLALGETYLVEKIVRHNWSTSVFLKGFEKPFNSVFFENTQGE